MKLPLLAAALACFSLAAMADEAEVRKAAETRLGKVEKIAKAPMAGMWEVWVEGQIFYIDDKATHVLFGNLLDMKTGKNITAERQFNALPLDLALKQVRGSGKNVMVTFEDPNCGYCKKLAKELAGMNDVTVYTFLTPVLGPDSQKKSEQIWCAGDRLKAWNDWMTANVAPPAASAACDMAGLQKVTALGEKYRVRGTPTIFLSNGERIPGYVPVAQLEKRIAGIK